MTARSCATCEHWSAYLPGLGECLEAVKRRQEAFMRAEDVTAFVAANPPLSARDTEAADVCDRWTQAETVAA